MLDGKSVNAGLAWGWDMSTWQKEGLVCKECGRAVHSSNRPRSGRAQTGFFSARLARKALFRSI